MNEPVTLVEIDRDVCTLTFGVAPCPATGTPCYNTWKTCAARPSFTAGVQVLRFAKARSDLPLSWDAIPSVTSTSASPTELNVGDVDTSSGPLGKRAQATITFQDHPTSDAKIDPYVSGRSLNPFTHGTFWSKLQARWQYSKGRPIRILDGYIGQDPSAMVRREYLIDSIDGPDSAGRVTIRAVDPLRILDDKTSQAPKQSRGELASAITAVATSLTVAGAVLADYPASGTMRIGSELMMYANVAAFGSGAAWNFETSTESWTVASQTQSATSGFVRLTPTTTDPQWLSPSFSISGSANRKITIRIRRVSGTGWDGSLFYSTSGHGFSGSFFKAISDTTVIGQWVDMTWDMENLTAGGSDWISNTITSIRLDLGVGVGDVFDVEFVVIGEPTSLSFLNLTRATDGTTAAAHELESRVQTCIRYTDVNAWEVARSIIQTYAPAAYSYIDNTQWESEAAQWLDGFIVSSVISEATGVNQLLAELCRDAQFFIWWDERTQKILLKAVRPPTETPVQWNEDANILAGSQSIRTRPEERISQIWYYYQPRDLSKKVDDDANYRKVRIRVDGDAESVREYDEVAVTKIFSRWVRTDAIVTAITTRLLNRYRDSPYYLTISVDAKDRGIWTADVVDVTSRLITNTEGLPLSTRYQVISAQETSPGSVVKYVLQNYNFSSRYGYWMAADAPTFAAATDEEKANGGWWADADGKISGVDGYQYQ